MKAPQLKREVGVSFYVFHFSKEKAFCIIYKIDNLHANKLNKFLKMTGN